MLGHWKLRLQSLYNKKSRDMLRVYFYPSLWFHYNLCFCSNKNMVERTYLALIATFIPISNLPPSPLPPLPPFLPRTAIWSETPKFSFPTPIRIYRIHNWFSLQTHRFHWRYFIEDHGVSNEYRGSRIKVWGSPKVLRMSDKKLVVTVHLNTVHCTVHTVKAHKTSVQKTFRLFR